MYQLPEVIYLIQVIDQWQSLFGALIGTLVPILVAFFLYSYKQRKEFQKNLIELEKYLVFSINELYDLREDLDLFLTRLTELIDSTEKRPDNEFSTPVTNFPLRRIDYDRRLMTTSTQSVYLTNKLIRCFTLLKSIDTSLNELREEYKNIIKFDKDIILSYKDKKNSIGMTAKEQKDIHLTSVIALKNVIESSLKLNILTATKNIFAVRIVLNKYRKNRFFNRIKYEGFGYRTAKKENGQDLIESKFKNELDKVISHYEQKFENK